MKVEISPVDQTNSWQNGKFDIHLVNKARAQGKLSEISS